MKVDKITLKWYPGVSKDDTIGQRTDKQLAVFVHEPVAKTHTIVAELFKTRPKKKVSSDWLYNETILLVKTDQGDYKIYSQSTQVVYKRGSGAYWYGGAPLDKVEFRPCKGYAPLHGGLRLFWRKYYSRALRQNTKWEIVKPLPPAVIKDLQCKDFVRALARAD